MTTFDRAAALAEIDEFVSNRPALIEAAKGLAAAIPDTAPALYVDIDEEDAIQFWRVDGGDGVNLYLPGGGRLAFYVRRGSAQAKGDVKWAPGDPLPANLLEALA